MALQDTSEARNISLKAVDVVFVVVRGKVTDCKLTLSHFPLGESVCMCVCMCACVCVHVCACVCVCVCVLATAAVAKIL